MSQIRGRIAHISKLLQNKQISCEELTNQYLQQIDQLNGTLNAYVNVTPEAALETARKVDRKIAQGTSISPLAGIPMTLKDNISTKGIETTCCS